MFEEKIKSFIGRIEELKEIFTEEATKADVEKAVKIIETMIGR